MTVQLKIRRMKTGETLIAEFETAEDAETWLRERPDHVNVLGTVGELPEALDERLREAMRPLDEEERKAAEISERESAERVRAALRREQEQAMAKIAEAREAAKDLDPNRPMAVAFERGKGIENADPADPREVPEIVRKAVLAWVAERDVWVHPRGQYVATAGLVVWPGPIPDGPEGERVQPGGQFTTLSGDPPELGS